MNTPIKISLLASGLFLLTGMLIGIVKHQQMLKSPDHNAPAYIDIAHRAAFLYSFAMLVIAKLLEFSPYSESVQLLATALVLTFLSITIVGYFAHGMRNKTDNLFRERSFSTTGLSLTFLGMDRDRSLYPAIMMVIAALYVLFAAISGSTEALLAESAAGAVFVGLAAAGFKRSLWLVVFALAAHGVFDLLHSRIIVDPGVPGFWPVFCSAYDFVAAAYLAVLIRRDRVPTT
jgi:hypothetical protein